MEYSDDYLIGRLLSKVEEDSESKSIVSKKAVFVKAIITRKYGKTYIENFESVCKSMKKDPEHVREYLEKKLKKNVGEITISAKMVLIITGSHTSPEIEGHIKNYVRTYVICSEPKCGSDETELIKSNRILYLACKKCNSRKAVNEK